MKRALVTGGSGQIGAGICSRLARDGFHVVIHANQNSAAARRLADSINGQQGSAEAISFDVTDSEISRERLAALLEGGPIQVVVNNAGYHLDAPLAGMTGEQWKSVVEVSLHGFYNVTQPLLMPMIRTRWGRIISISSVSGLIGNRGQANYAAAKAGLHGATRSLALEVASRGITVNCVAPGIIQPDGAEGHFSAEAIKELVPMQRAGTPAEVAALVSFLASGEASYISGQIISINGGMA